MTSFSSAVSIGRTAEQIFPHLLDTTKHAPGSNAPVGTAAQGALENGARLNVSYTVGPLKAVVGLQIMALDFGKRLAFRSYTGPVAWEGEYQLADNGNGSTTVSQTGELTVKGLWRLLPFAGGEIKRSEIRELRRLKTVMEGSPVN